MTAPGVDGRNRRNCALNYNVGGICLSEPAFRKLQQEIALSPRGGNLIEPGFNGPWVDEQCELFVGTVPVSTGVFS